jgi:parvulin-like peptidyl-prolyl isomerase
MSRDIEEAVGRLLTRAFDSSRFLSLERLSQLNICPESGKILLTFTKRNLMSTQNILTTNKRSWMTLVIFSLFTFHFSFLTAFAQEGEKRSARLLDGVAAYVNQSKITIAEVMSEVRRVPIDNIPEQDREKRLREMYQVALVGMIDRRLILDAAKKQKVQLQPWAVNARVREILVNNFDNDEAKLNLVLADRKITKEEWRQTLEQDMLLSAMRYQNVEKRVNITPGEVRAEYEANKARYRTESAVSVSMIVLDPPEKETDETVAARATKIAAALKEGKSFAELARQYSKDSKASIGGSWGKVNPEDVFRKELAEALAKLKAGEVSPLIVLGSYGYILRKDDQQDVRMLTFEEAQPYVESRLKVAKAEQLYKEWITRLRKDSYIRVFELPSPKK